MRQIRTFASSAGVKSRIKSISGINKIVKAMRLVATAKLRQSQERRQIGTAFAEPIVAAYKSLSLPVNLNKPQVVLGITSDRGLCGATNSAIYRVLSGAMKQTGFSALLISGSKVPGSLAEHDTFIGATPRPTVSFELAKDIASQLQALSEKHDNAYIGIVYNRYQTALTYKTEHTVLTPLDPKKLGPLFEEETDPVEFYKFAVSCAVFEALLHAQSTEQSQRCLAMDNASRNASEILENLSVKYNKTRQAKITMELIEIVSGSTEQNR